MFERKNELKEVLDIQKKLSKMNKEIKVLEAEKEKLINVLLAKGMTEDEKYKIETNKVERRFLLVKEFIERFPEIAKRISVIPVLKAENLLGKETIADLCEMKMSVYYKVIEKE